MIRGGRSYVSSQPAFSNDTKRLLVCSANSVSIFSTATGLPLTSLEGHTALVTSVIVAPASTPASKVLCYCWTASLDGTIRYWDFATPEPIKVVDIKFPIWSMVIPSWLAQPAAEPKAESSSLFAYVSTEDIMEGPQNHGQALRGQIRKCNLTESRLAGKMILAETQRPEFITVSSSGKYFGILLRRKLHIWKVPVIDSKGAGVTRITLHHTKSMSVLAFHPTQRIVAVGDVTGRILIWRGFGSRSFGDGLVSERSMKIEEERPGVRGDDDADSCTTWHWHPSELNILFFSSDGAYLYSGGKEGVLVVWQLDTGKKKFLPRIGSPLLWFKDSLDPSLSSISCADNQIHLLKMPSMEILKSISGIKPPCPFPETIKGSHSGVAFDHNAGLVALRTENYCIQLYSLLDDRGISEVQVCERNHQPGDEVTIAVTLAVLSLDGSMMGTAEVKLAEEGLGGLVCLKFWASGLQKKFSLSTIIYEPHRDAGISAIAFHPTRRMAVSSSYGGDFKVWVCNNVNKPADQVLSDSAWTCHAVGSYKKKPMTAATFSADGSVLAVAAETVITLWDVENNVLVAVIGDSITPIVNLSFVGRSEYLVSASWGSKSQLFIWSMSKLSVSWSYMLHVEAIANAADLSYFAVLALLPESSNCKEPDTQLKRRDGVILLFNAECPSPLATWSVKKAKGGALAFLQVNHLSESITDGQPPQALLAYVNSNHEFVLFDPLGKETYERNMIRREGQDLHESGKFGYASIYGELPEFGLKRKQASWVPSAQTEKPWETIFNGSSHNLPPLTKLCSAFLESLLEKRTTITDVQ